MPGDEIYDEGRTKTYSHSFSLDPSDEVVGLLGYVKVSFYDKNGNKVDDNLVSNLAEPDPATNDIPLSLTNNIRILDESETTQLGMLLISFPMSIASLIMIIISIALIPVFIKRKFSMRKLAAIILIAGIIQVLAFVFLYMGIDNLVTILDDSLKANLRDDFQFTSSIYMIFIPGILTVISSIMIMVTSKKPEKKVEKEEPEEDTFSIVKDDNIPDNGPYEN
jgi:hypothetical protein